MSLENSTIVNFTTGAPVEELLEQGWFYVVGTLGVTIVFQLLCFMIAASCKFDLITDLAGSMNFILLALLSLCLRDVYDTRQIVLSAIVSAARLELALFLLIRVCVRKSDARFDETREKCCKFLMFWIFQMCWVWICMLPVVYVNSTDLFSVAALGAADYVAWALMLFGFVFQVVADVHKYLFKKDPANKDKICDTGVWSISRHPNYFGEMVLWWGVYIAAVPVMIVDQDQAWWAVVVSPLFTMLILLGGSGIPTSEGKKLGRFYNNPKKRDAYARYHRRTPPCIPWCPGCYEKFPMGCKAVFCCEFPCYQYKPDPDKVDAADANSDTKVLLNSQDNDTSILLAEAKQSETVSPDK